MGRHSRKGSAPPVADTGQQAGAGTGQGAVPAGPPPGTGRRRRSTGGDGQEAAGPQGYGTPAHGTPVYGTPAHGTPQYGTPAHGTPQYGTPAHGTPQYGTPAHGTPMYGTPAQGSPRYGAPAQGAPPYGAPARGAGRFGASTPVAPVQGAPAYGTPRHGTPAHGTPAYAGGASDTPAHGTPGTPAHGVPVHGASVRGGHPQHEETSAPRPGSSGPRHGARRTAATEQADPQAPFIPGPRRESAVGDPETEAPAGGGGLGRTLTGVAAAAVATVLAVVVAGQVADRDEAPPVARAAEKPAERPTDDTSASRSDDRTVPSKPAPAVTPPTYEQLMTRQFPIDPKLKGSGEFEAVPGLAKAPGKGELIRYRIDVEKGLGLDPKLFADAVQKTLNDKRSWAGQGEMTFERISSGDPKFVITLASPGTTGAWCAKSGLDTTVDNVSCDSASTQRVMINAFRWAQGSSTFGPKAMYAYRQMLINHEVGHRLGHGHVSCQTAGALAPVMQQQTKSLNVDGIKCRPNPWVYPKS
ncbi:hypothetical protein GCM10010222_03950 [Streptomyces tanashiensis]|uniref:DUF3152 domain-containing protein n=1 Tax=Streptomyces tanashiensis TaxID=67367 RepID=UPI0019C7DCDD|nr:DUF3152 domain-containing protein [Streptomyces tanashiensis]GGS66698.1 hypothetical protein GCM10010222_03950 [Streptomyces tanashiensis]